MWQKTVLTGFIRKSNKDFKQKAESKYTVADLLDWLQG